MVEPDGWQRLIEHLDAWSSAAEVAPGRIDVSVPQGAGRRQVVVVMTPDEWDDMAGVMWGNFEDAVEDVKRTLLALLPQEGFAVYAPYRLYPSIEATLPESPLPRPESGGEWVAYDQEGRVESRLAEWSAPDEAP